MYPSTKCPFSFLQIIHTIYVQCRQNILRWTIYTTLTISLLCMPVTDQQLMLILSPHFSTKNQTPTTDSSRCRKMYAAITIRFSYKATSLSLYFELASLHNARCSKNSKCSRTCVSQLIYCNISIVNKWRISKSSACRETTETFKMTTNLFVVQPLYHWHALVDTGH